MNIDILNQELSEKIENLQAKLDDYKRQKEVASIIKGLKSAENLKLGYTTVMKASNENISISLEGLNDFIRLLNSNEYLKGFSSGSSDLLGPQPRSHNFYTYYLTFGEGKLLELTFRETKIKGYRPQKECGLTIRSYVDSQDLYIKVVPYAGHPRIEIAKQNGESVCGTLANNQYLALHGRKLNEALTPISPDDLVNRFAEMINKPNEKGINL